MPRGSCTSCTPERKGTELKKIAMLNCLKANQVCTGAACLQAWNRREKSFSRYVDEPVELVAFLRCNGCQKDPIWDKGILEKLDRLQAIGVDVVHAGVCTKRPDDSRCPTIQCILTMLEERGISWVDGTHQ